MNELAPIEHDIERTYALLGGQRTIRRPIRTSLEAHDLLMHGLPSSALVHLAREVSFLGSDAALEKAIGISTRTLQRRKREEGERVLNTEQSSRTWKFAEILGRATEIFGSREAAEDWMSTPALGLDNRRPIDLLATAIGVEAVEDYLTRIDYGVYT